MSRELFIPPYVLDAKLRESLRTGDSDGAASYQAMLQKHETGTDRIKKAHADFSVTNANTTVAP